MAVKIRMKRMGRTNRAFFRLQAIDGRMARNGRLIEELGHYDPLVQDQKKAVVVKKERIEYWLGVGAQPSPTVARILKASGITVAPTKTAGAR